MRIPLSFWREKLMSGIRAKSCRPQGGKYNGRSRGGYSLIELLIVVAVIGILATTAIPILMQARQRSLDAKAHNSMRNVISAQQSFYASNSRFGSLDELATNDPPYLDERFLGGTGELGHGIVIELAVTDGGHGFSATALNPAGSCDYTADQSMQIVED